MVGGLEGTEHSMGQIAADDIGTGNGMVAWPVGARAGEPARETRVLENSRAGWVEC